MRQIIEAGHYYKAIGPTVWSEIGWQLGQQMIQPGDATMLFIDDVHTAEQAHPLERAAQRVNGFAPVPTYTVLESSVAAEAKEALAMLYALPKKNRPVVSADGTVFCSGAPLVSADGASLCTLLDVGLTLRKSRLGFTHGVNILPDFYQAQQEPVLRLVQRILPDFHLAVVLFATCGTNTNIVQS
jgi:hypothetical protein